MLSACEPGETVSRAVCLPDVAVEWLECRLSNPGRAGPAEGLGDEADSMADGIAAGSGWEVEALGILLVFCRRRCRFLLTPGLSPRGAITI